MANLVITYWKLHKLPILLMIVSLLLYYFLGYHLERTEFYYLLIAYSGLFFLCFKLIQFEKWNFRFLLFAGCVFRLALLLAVPSLSEDFYRFIWDGSLFISGVNPYAFIPASIPEEVLANLPQGTELLDGMSDLSRNHYSNYPPLNQLFFALTSLLGGKSIIGSTIAIRSLLIISDLGILYFGRKLLKLLNLSPHLIFWYFLNPLVILELTGNLHFEGLMLFFFIWAMVLTHTGKWKVGAMVYGLAISVKLIPLIFLPLFIPYFKLKKSIIFFTLAGLTVLLTTLPFVTPNAIVHYSDTLSLWFTNFEFNAGIYNLVEYIGVGFDAKPWELIKIYGKVVALITIVIVLLLTFIRKPRTTSAILSSMLWVLTFYYLTTTTVHPWYLISLILITVFTPYRFPLFWSALVILSYAAYDNPEYTEYPYLILIEYSVVIGMLLYEYFRFRRENSVIQKKSGQD